MGYYFTKESSDLLVKIDSFTKESSDSAVKIDYFNLLPEDMQLKILLDDDTIAFKSILINSYFNKLILNSFYFMNKIINLPMVDEFSKLTGMTCYRSKNDLLTRLASHRYIIYTWYYSHYFTIRLIVDIYQQEFGPELNSFQFDDNLCQTPVDIMSYSQNTISKCFKKNIHNLDLFSKYLIYLNRGYNIYGKCDKYLNIVKNKILLELEQLYQSLNINNDKASATSTLFNVYILVQRCRFDPNYCKALFRHGEYDKYNSVKQFVDTTSIDYSMNEQQKCIMKNVIKINHNKLHPEKFDRTSYEKLLKVIKEFNLVTDLSYC